MNLFKIAQDGLVSLEEIPFKLERQLQKIFEENLSLLTGLEFISTEFAIQNQRLDTLAFDPENSSFVIIEYKRSTNISVLDQGVSYLNTLLKYKADFILEYQEKTGKLLTKKDVDWSQSKVAFVSPTFTQFQKQAVDFKDLNIELWEVKSFSNHILSVNGISKSKNAPSIKSTKSLDSEELSTLAEIKTYTEDEHLLTKPDSIQELYEEFKQAILLLVADAEVIPKKQYIAFKKDNHNLVDIEIQSRQLKLFINAKKGLIDDPKNIARDVANIGHYGNGDYELKVSNTNDLEYIMSLVKQIL